MPKIVEMVSKLAQPIVEELGYMLWDIEYLRKGNADSELVVYIDKKGGVTLDDCEAVSRALDAPLDEADPISESYILCVSSPGIERVLKNDVHLNACIGQTVDVKLYEKRENKKEFMGKLILYDDEFLVIEPEPEKELALKREKVAQIKLHANF